MDESIFEEAIKVYKSYCDGIGEPYIERSKVNSYIDGDICFLVSDKAYAIKYLISMKQIIG
jgi:hypothetical protein